jgi:hypothetical protein
VYVPIAKIPLHSKSVKIRVRVGHDSPIRREMDAEAVEHALWIALKLADDAGFDALVDDIGRLHLQAIRLRQSVEMVA